MKKSTQIITLIIPLLISLNILASDNEVFENFTPKHVDPVIQHDTLLVIEYQILEIDDPAFSQLQIDSIDLVKFIERENKKIQLYNEKLKKVFSKFYYYPFKIINEKELATHSSKNYPFVYKRYLDTKNGKDLSYTRFFMNRKDKMLFKDINLYTHNSRERILIEKDIIIALTYFIENEEEHTVSASSN